MRERSGSMVVLDPRPRSHGFEPHRRHCVVSLCKTHLSLVLVQPRKTRPDITVTDRLLMRRKESNQTISRGCCGFVWVSFSVFSYFLDAMGRL